MNAAQPIDWWPIVSSAFSALAVLVVTLVGVLVRGIVQSLRDLKEEHETTRNRFDAAHENTRVSLASVRELIAGNYIPRVESQEARDALRAEFRHEQEDLERRLRAVEAGTIARRRNDR